MSELVRQNLFSAGFDRLVNHSKINTHEYSVQCWRRESWRKKENGKGIMSIGVQGDSRQGGVAVSTWDRQ